MNINQLFSNEGRRGTKQNVYELSFARHGREAASQSLFGLFVILVFMFFSVPYKNSDKRRKIDDY